jgi:predicted cupin superfamily sugar epimerase
MNKHDVIRCLGLIEHIEGGYFSETYQSLRQTTKVSDPEAIRPLM